MLSKIDSFRNVGSGFVYFLTCLSSVKSNFFSWREELGGAHSPCLVGMKCQQLTAIILSWRGHHGPARDIKLEWPSARGGEMGKWRLQGEGQSSEITLRCCELVPAPQHSKHYLGHGFSPQARTRSKRGHEAPGSPQGLGSSRDVFSK